MLNCICSECRTERPEPQCRGSCQLAALFGWQLQHLMSQVVTNAAYRAASSRNICALERQAAHVPRHLPGMIPIIAILSGVSDAVVPANTAVVQSYTRLHIILHSAELLCRAGNHSATVLC